MTSRVELDILVVLLYFLTRAVYLNSWLISTVQDRDYLDTSNQDHREENDPYDRRLGSVVTPLRYDVVIALLQISCQV